MNMTLPSRRPVRFAAALLVLLLMALLLGACGGADDAPATSAGPSIAPESLPAGFGRGYPTVAAEGDADATQARPGEPAPNFRLTLADGSSLSLESLRGRPVLINHWATWCGPCRLEMPEIVEAAKAHPDLVVVGANLMETQETMAPFVEQYAMEFPVTVDPDGLLSQLYGVRGLPMTIFIDREGVISAVWAGILTPDKLDELLGQIL
jgi:cytochrome c biogenesis protein CcmG/thiol:disulfide interchange protein DsbE